MSRIKLTREDLIFDIITYVFLGLALIIVAYPLYFVIIASISNPYAVTNGDVIFIPEELTFEGFERIFLETRIWIGYRNTIVYTVIGTLINVTLTLMVAYPLSRKKFSGRNVIMVYMMITAYFSGGLIPQYLLVKNLGIRNSWLVMVVLGAVSFYNVVIARSFMQSNIPEELEESASIDGCSAFVFFGKFVLPLSKALTAVLVLYYGVGHWNDYFRAMIYLNDEVKYPLQLILRSILLQTELSAGMLLSDPESMEAQQKVAELIKYGVIIVASVPVLILYPALQKYFIQGVMIGSIKG